MKILVTGGAGFIGSHLVERLLTLNHTVHVIDNFDPFYDKSIKKQNLAFAEKNINFKLYEVDIRNNSELTDYFKIDGRGIDAVVHLAARAGVRPSIDDPLGYYETNVIGTLNILENMKISGIKKMIFASSSSVYGNNKKIPFSEDDNVDHPISPYAATKKAGELLCYNYHHLYDFDIYALRFFTVYGPRQRPEMAIHKFTRLIEAGEKIKLFGYGKLKRDFTYISDIIDGVVNSINNVNGYQVLNIGGNDSIEISRLIKILEEVTGKKAQVDLCGVQPGDVDQTVASVEKASRLIGFSPKVNIESGISLFYEWFNNNSLTVED